MLDKLVNLFFFFFSVFFLCVCVCWGGGGGERDLKKYRLKQCRIISKDIKVNLFSESEKFLLLKNFKKTITLQ